MTFYQPLIDKITIQTDATFRPASATAIAQLRVFKLPDDVIDFYAHYEPEEWAEGQVRL